MDGWFGDGGAWDAHAIERERADVAHREGRESYREAATMRAVAVVEVEKLVSEMRVSADTRIALADCAIRHALTGDSMALQKQVLELLIKDPVMAQSAFESFLRLFYEPNGK